MWSGEDKIYKNLLTALVISCLPHFPHTAFSWCHACPGSFAFSSEPCCAWPRQPASQILHTPHLRPDLNPATTATILPNMAENEKTVHEKGSIDSERTATNVENAAPRKKSFSDIDMDKLSAAFENPLSNIPKDQLLQEVETFCQEHGLMDHIDAFRKGALVAQNPHDIDGINELSLEDREALNREHTHRWSQPFTLYWLVVMCSLAAAVQGMDETVNNGAQALYLKELGVTTDRFSPDMVDSLTGIIVGAPYLCCCLIGCWVNEPCNRIFARRGTIFISCLIAALASIWEGVANSWVNLFLARFVLGKLLIHCVRKALGKSCSDN